MEKQQKKRVKKYISWGLIAVLVTVLACMPLIAGSQENTEGPTASILSAAAERGNISTNLVGGGTLTSEQSVEITIPSAVKLTEYLVASGDTVEAGAPIANVDRVTVMTAITQVQETLEYLAEEIEDIRDDEASDEVIAQAGGTVKIVHAQEGESVQTVMLEHGALAVLSLDGLMAVQVDRNTDLSSGDCVCVTFSDGTETDGKVESNLEGILTVTLEDDGYAVGERVTVTSDAGNRIGTGTLYIHSQWNATAYSGFVKNVRISEGDSVKSGKTLFDLEDTGHTAQYQQMVNQHREYEELMLELFKMYQTESIYAPCAGVVTGVDEEGVYMLSDGGNGGTLMLLANAPNGNDAITYLNYIGQVASVGTDGLNMMMNPQLLTITDYKDLSMVPMDTALMTQSAVYTAQAPVYELVDGVWMQIEASAIMAGDILLFAGDASGDFVWVVRVARGTVTPEIPEPSQPTEPGTPTDPSTPTEPADPSEPTTPAEPSVPTTPNQPSISFPQMGGTFGGGVMQQEEEYELYTLETVTVASVIPQEEMTVEITIDELDVAKIYVGQSAAVTVDALSGERFTAVVTDIANTGESDGGNSKFTVELTLEKSGDMLPGMYASAVITLGTAGDCVTVPVAALNETGTQTFLYTSYDEDTGELGDPIAVTVGISDGETAQILSGVGEGDVCYYAYYDTLEISNIPDMGGGFFFGR